MEKQSKFRFLTLLGIFAILSLSLSSCFYGGSYGYRERYYARPSYGYRVHPRPPVRVYVAPPTRYAYKNNYNRHRNYSHQNRSYRGNSRSNRSHGRR